MLAVVACGGAPPSRPKQPHAACPGKLDRMVVELVRRLVADDWSTRQQALYDLGRLGSDANKLVPCLVVSLRLTSNAGQALEQIGPAAVPGLSSMPIG